MILLRKYIDDVHAQLIEAVRDYHAISNTRKKRLRGFMVMLVGQTPIHLFTLLWINLIGLFVPAMKPKARAKFLRRQIDDFWRHRGLMCYPTRPLPPHFEHPTIIFVTRYSDTSSLIAHHLFDFPVIIPLSPNVKRKYRLHPFSPWPKLTKALTQISYPDTSMPKAVERIQRMLAAGYDVVVHINENYADPRYYDKLPLSKSITPLIDYPHVLFMNYDGLEFSKDGTFDNPTTVRCDIATRDSLEYSLLSWQKEDPEAFLRVVAKFYGFDDFEWVSW